MAVWTSVPQILVSMPYFLQLLHFCLLCSYQRHRVFPENNATLTVGVVFFSRTPDLSTASGCLCILPLLSLIATYNWWGVKIIGFVKWPEQLWCEVNCSSNKRRTGGLYEAIPHKQIWSPSWQRGSWLPSSWVAYSERKSYNGRSLL